MDYFQKSKIVETSDKVKALSYSEINLFSDSTIHLKKALTEKTNRLNELNDNLEKITWLNILDTDCFALIKDLIVLSKDLHVLLSKQYKSMNTLKDKGIVKEEIRNFKNAIEDLEEIYTDIESVYFLYPGLPEFIEITRQLSTF